MKVAFHFNALHSSLGSNYGNSTEKLLFSILLSYLTLAQVFDALSFYLDHQAEINYYIERNQVPYELVHPSVKATRKDHPLTKFAGILSDAEATEIKQSIAECRRVDTN